MTRRLVPRLRRDRRGVTAMEFALITPPMMLLLMGGLDLAHQSFVRTVMQGALNNIARTAAVEDPIIQARGSTITEQVQNAIRDRILTIAPRASVEVTQESFFEFSNIGNPEVLMRDNDGDGQYDAADDDCYEDANRNDIFDTDTGIQGRGDANDVVFYTATVQMPRLIPVHTLLPVSPTVTLQQQTAVRNQPFGVRPIPPVVCGDD